MSCLIADSGPLIAFAKLGLLAPLLEKLHHEGYFISPTLTASVLAQAGEA